MPRIARKSLGTNFYHIIVQGINREYIFSNNKYIEKYIELMTKYRYKYTKVKMIAYCIMNNHAHMLIYSDCVEEMGNFMKALNISYARYYNDEERRVGYVFRDRYLSQPIYEENYLYKCINYIHKNPVVAKIVNKESEYTYSSYNEYINKEGIVTKEILKLIFGTEENYLKVFLTINEEEGSFIDCEGEREKPEEIINYYCTSIRKELTDIINNEEILKEMLSYLIGTKKISKHKLEKLLGVNRHRITRLLGS